MAIEIERKFLLKNKDWKKLANQGQVLQQGYLSLDPEKTVRVRTKKDKGYLTIKGKGSSISRQEFEYEIPLADAQALLELCQPSIIQKTRYIVPYQEHIWEIDVFEGDNQGLVLAEVELQTEEESILLPSWVGTEVSEDKRYYNACLVECPFKEW